MGTHTIIGVQGATQASDTFTPQAVTPVDDRVWGVLQSTGTEVGNTEGKLDGTKDSLLNGTNGLAAIKGNTSAINTEVSNIEGKLDARGNLMMGPPKDAALLAAGYTQLYPPTEYFDLTGNMIWGSMNYLGPEARYSHTAVWTGSEMLVRGGQNGSAYLNSGGRYNPATDTPWTAMSTTGALEARGEHTAVWTGNYNLESGTIIEGRSLWLAAGMNPRRAGWQAASLGAAERIRATQVREFALEIPHSLLWGDSFLLGG